MKLRTKLILGFTLTAIIPVVFGILFLYRATSDLMLTNALQDEHADVMIKKIDMQRFLDGIGEDVLFLSELSTLGFLIDNPSEDNREIVERDFLKFSENKHIYYQVRYLDKTGQEIVRIDSDGIAPQIVPQEKLQNKKGRYYFDDTLDMKKGEVFVSPLDLNIERGEIENRGTDEEPVYVPVIRYGTPVFDQENNKRGIVLFNVYADNFLVTLQDGSLHLDEGNQTFLVDKDGHFLFNSLDHTLEWGFMFDKDTTVYSLYPSIAAKLFDEVSGQFYDKLCGCHVTYERIKQGDQVFWVIYTSVDEEKLLEGVDDVFIQLGYVFFIIIIIMIVIGSILGHLWLLKIHKIKQGVDMISQGNLAYRIPINGGDELEQLSESFNSMAAQLDTTQKNIENKIEKRTEQLEKMNAMMTGRELKMIELKKEIKNISTKNKKTKK